MKKITTNLLTIFVYLVLFTTNYITAQSYEFSYDNVKSNLEFLADDLLEGREAASRGEKLASQFIASELKKYGVKPFGDDGTYFQDFDLNIYGFSKNSTIEIIQTDNSTIVHSIGENFVALSRQKIDQSRLNKNYSIVFVGYGLVIPELNVDDYESINVKDKVVIVLAGENLRDNPKYEGKQFPNRFDSRNNKIKNAVENGAAGIIMPASRRMEQYWDYYSSNADAVSYSLPDSSSESRSSIPGITITSDLVKQLFDGEEYDFTQIEEFIKEFKSIPKFDLNKKINFKLDIKDNKVAARNIVGIVEGNDPQLKQEIVSLGAHYDHVGIIGDEVYNGADDNASGTVTILETIRAAAEKNENRRSVMVVFHTAEEKGLLGAKYFTDNFTRISDVVVNINIDMVGRESSDSIYCIGSDKLSTELDEIVREANDKTSQFYLDYSFNDPDDPQRLYYRSDHVHYARKNIPIVFFYDYMKEDYHRASDDVEKINYEKILKVCNLIYQIAIDVANLNHRLIVDGKFD